MKHTQILFISFLILCGLQTAAQTNNKSLDKPDTSKKILIAEVSCGNASLKWTVKVVTLP